MSDAAPEAQQATTHEAPARSIDAFKAIFRNPNLRRLQLAWAGSNLGTWGFGVALAVFAYDRGGAAAVTGHAGSAEAAEAVIRSYGPTAGIPL